jgi:hypothetical protein
LGFPVIDQVVRAASSYLGRRVRVASLTPALPSL